MALPTTPYARQWAYKALKKALGIYPTGSSDMAQMVTDIDNARKALGEPPRPKFMIFPPIIGPSLLDNELVRFARGGMIKPGPFIIGATSSEAIRPRS